MLNAQFSSCISLHFLLHYLLSLCCVAGIKVDRLSRTSSFETVASIFTKPHFYLRAATIALRNFKMCSFLENEWNLSVTKMILSLINFTFFHLLKASTIIHQTNFLWKFRRQAHYTIVFYQVFFYNEFHYNERKFEILQASRLKQVDIKICKVFEDFANILDIILLKLWTWVNLWITWKSF